MCSLHVYHRARSVRRGTISGNLIRIQELSDG
jgi:hypothetical protein